MPRISIEVETDNGTEEHEVDIDFYCAECGADINHLVELHPPLPMGSVAFSIGLCEDCVERLESEGYEEGYMEAIAERDE